MYTTRWLLYILQNLHNVWGDYLYISTQLTHIYYSQYLFTTSTHFDLVLLYGYHAEVFSHKFSLLDVASNLASMNSEWQQNGGTSSVISRSGNNGVVILWRGRSLRRLPPFHLHIFGRFLDEHHLTCIQSLEQVENNQHSRTNLQN